MLLHMALVPISVLLALDPVVDENRLTQDRTDYILVNDHDSNYIIVHSHVNLGDCLP